MLSIQFQLVSYIQPRTDIWEPTMSNIKYISYRNIGESNRFVTDYSLNYLYCNAKATYVQVISANSR